MSDPYIPVNTQIKLQLAQNGDLDVHVNLPGQSESRIFRDLVIEEGTLHIPLKTVFLSHVKEDRKKVIDIQNELHKMGIVAWRDQLALRGGDDWEEKIGEAIDSSDYGLIFLSRNSETNKGFYQKEVERIWNRKAKIRRFLIPVILDDICIPSQYKAIQCLRISDGIPKLLDELQRAII